MFHHPDLWQSLAIPFSVSNERRLPARRDFTVNDDMVSLARSSPNAENILDADGARSFS
jgi:hypothetical protein